MAKAPEPKPANAARRGTRGMARAAGLSRAAIRRIWRAVGLRPPPGRRLERPTPPYLVETVRDGVGLSLGPPGRAVGPSADETPGAQAVDRTRPVLPMPPGQAERGTHDDARPGTASRLAALGVATGKAIGRCRRRHRCPEFGTVLGEIDAAVPAGEGVTVRRIRDADAAHKTPAVTRWRTKPPRFVARVTPTSGSWRTQVERFVARAADKRLRRGVFKTVKASGRAVGAYLAEHDARPEPFPWTATADLILREVEDVCKRTLTSGH